MKGPRFKKPGLLKRFKTLADSEGEERLGVGWDQVLPFPSFILLLGAGIGPTIQIGEETVITVDAKAAGKGKVTCTVCTPDGTEVDVDVVENEDGTFDIFYTAPQPGKYVICVRFGGEHIPNSPFQVTVSFTLPKAGEIFISVPSMEPAVVAFVGNTLPPV